MDDTIEEAFQGLEPDEFFGWLPGALHLPLEIEIASASERILACAFRRTISRALRIARSAPCRDFAISIKATGLAPLRRSQRRIASHAMSDPSRCQNRITSTSERSGEYRPTVKPCAG